MKQLSALIWKHRKASIVTLCLVLFFLVSSFVTYKTFVRQFLFKDYVVYESRELSDQNIHLNYYIIEQPIQLVSKSMSGIGLRFKDVNPQSNNEIQITIKDGSNKSVHTENVPENKIANDGFYYVRTNRDHLKVGDFYTISIQSLGSTQASLATVNPKENE